MGPFSTDDLDRFLRTGWLRLDDAFPRAVAGRCRAALWRRMGLSPRRPEAWTKPAVFIPYMASAPFLEAGRSPRVRAAFDQVCGEKAWKRLRALGGIPVRFPPVSFPSGTDNGDTGWHVDLSLDTAKPDFWDWRVNVASEGRSLLALFLLSDVGEDDAPTILREGSHAAIVRLLAGKGRRGMTARELHTESWGGDGFPERLATGPAGTLYLLHPFVVHRAQAHRGTRVRFMAQQIVLPRDGAPPPGSPVSRATALALAGTPPAP